MIKFDSLPKENPGGGVPKPGLYLAKITKADYTAYVLQVVFLAIIIVTKFI